jgi:4a-hydroxytetrahydrobiopterin dehydratase
MALLHDEEIEAKLGGVDGWERYGDTLRKEFELKDFVGSVEFAGKLVEPAEEMNHHPDLEISWNKVTVSLATHSEGGITERDFELAKKINEVAA